MTNEELAKLLMETGHHHHGAYESSNGVDPEWALWYSGFLQSRIWDSYGEIPTRSKLVHLLLAAEEHHLATAKDKEWPPVYAEYMASRLSASA